MNLFILYLWLLVICFIGAFIYGLIKEFYLIYKHNNAKEEYNRELKKQAEQERKKAERDKRLASDEIEALDRQVDSFHHLITALDADIEATHDNVKKAKLLKQQADLYKRCVTLSNKAERLRDKYNLE